MDRAGRLACLPRMGGDGVLSRSNVEHPAYLDVLVEHAKTAQHYRQMRQTQAIFARELGMTPLARQQLKASGTDAALDLAAAAVEYWETDDAVAVGDEEEAGDGSGGR